MDPSGGQPDWPEGRVVTLFDASTAVERDVLDRWLHEHSGATSDGEIETMQLPDPVSGWDDAAHAAFEARLRAGDDPWLAPVRVVWLPEEHDGRRAVRVRDVLRSLGNPRHPREFA